MNPQQKYIFIIDTEDYAGNFERDLCAWMTGMTGECGVGKTFARDVPVTVSSLFEDILDHRPDDHGIRRPCSIWPTPGWVQDGNGNEYRIRIGSKKKTYPAHMSVAIFFDQRPTTMMRRVLLERARTFNDALKKSIEKNPHLAFTFPLKITGFRLLTETISYQEVISWPAV